MYPSYRCIGTCIGGKQAQANQRMAFLNQPLINQLKKSCSSSIPHRIVNQKVPSHCTLQHQLYQGMCGFSYHPNSLNPFCYSYPSKPGKLPIQIEIPQTAPIALGAGVYDPAKLYPHTSSSLHANGLRGYHLKFDPMKPAVHLRVLR